MKGPGVSCCLSSLGHHQVAQSAAVAFGQCDGLEVPLVVSRPRRPLLREPAAHLADPRHAFIQVRHTRHSFASDLLLVTFVWRLRTPFRRRGPGRGLVSLFGMTDETGPDPASLPTTQFGFPGPLRDRLVAAVLDGSKTATTGVLADYERGGEALPEAGERSVVVDSGDRPVAVIEITEVRVVPLRDVDLPHAVDEGEGDDSVASWRRHHEEFWHGPEMRAAMGDPEFTVDDDTPLVLERFRLVADLRAAG